MNGKNEWQPRRYEVMEEDLNCNNTLFGGVAMGWMDKFGHQLAEGLTHQVMFTSSADKIKFLKPVFLGETVEIQGDVFDRGQVRLVMEMKVIADPDGPNRRVALTGLFTFVHLDENYRPRPISYPSDVQVC